LPPLSLLVNYAR